MSSITRIICSTCGVGNFVIGDRYRAITSDLLDCTEAACENKGLSRSHDIDPYVDTDDEILVWSGPFLAVERLP